MGPWIIGSMNTQDVIEILWERKGRGSSKDLAKSLGISQAFLSDVFNGKRELGDKIPKALGLVRLPEQYEYPKPSRRRA
jgi:transcriptional regulator with XRE-family HTH domain